MKRITKEYTVWKLDPKRVAVELLCVYGFVRLCMDVWSWLV
jgi:hypothetical protein